MPADLAEQCRLQLVNKALSQRLHGVGQDHIHAEKVIPRFNDIVDLDGSVVGKYTVGLQNIGIIYLPQLLILTSSFTTSPSWQAFPLPCLC